MAGPYKKGITRPASGHQMSGLYKVGKNTKLGPAHKLQPIKTKTKKSKGGGYV